MQIIGKNADRGVLVLDVVVGEDVTADVRGCLSPSMRSLDQKLGAWAGDAEISWGSSEIVWGSRSQMVVILVMSRNVFACDGGGGVLAFHG